MIAICPPSLAPLVPSGSVPLKDLILLAKASGKRPSQKIRITPTLDRKEYDRQYYLANRERKNAMQREYDAAHRDHIREYHRLRYQQKKVS
jgi:hypothetical protein